MPDLISHGGSLIKGTAARIAEVFDEQGELASVAVPSFYKVRSDDGAQYNVTALSGPGVLVKRSENSAYTVSRRYKTNDTNFIHSTYSDAIEVSMEQMMDREHDNIWDEVKQLRKAADFWKQWAVFQPFNGGFGTLATVNGIDITRYGDGLALFSTVHTRADGGATQSNASSTGIPLTESNFETQLIALKEQLLDDGTPIRDLGKISLLVPHNLEKTAKIIMGSTLRSGTSNNDMNVYTGGTYDVVSSHLISAVSGRAGGAVGSDTAWFLVAENLSKLMYIERLAPSLTQTKTETGGLKVKVDVRLSVGHSHWLGTIGSQGANAAYSS